MIEDGFITHGPFESALEAWQPDSFFLTALLIAILATALSYQVTGIIFDIFLGNKPRGEATAANIHTLLLTDESSPLSVAAALFRHDELDRARFYGDIPKSTKIVRDDASVSKGVACKLLFLLLTAPLVNLVAVVLALESDHAISFSDAHFGGVALGVSNKSVSHLPFGGPCARFSTRFANNTDDHAEFHSCQDIARTIQLPSPAEQSYVEVFGGQQGEVRATVYIQGLNAAYAVQRHAEVFTEGRVFRLPHALDLEGARVVAREAKQIIETGFCNVISSAAPIPEGVNPIRTQLARQGEANGDTVRVTETVNCAVDPSLSGLDNLALIQLPAALAFTLDRMSLTLVESSHFRVAEIDDLLGDGSAPPWFDIGHLQLLVRRRNIVAPAILSIVVATVLILRVVVEVFTNNDLHDGVEEIVSRSLNMKSPFHVIRTDELLRYNHKYQFGTRAHFGLARRGLPEVDNFDHGAIGIVDEEKEFYERGAMGLDNFKPDYDFLTSSPSLTD